jgi:hypothetical protein
MVAAAPVRARFNLKYIQYAGCHIVYKAQPQKNYRLTETSRWSLRFILGAISISFTSQFDQT